MRIFCLTVLIAIVGLGFTGCGSSKTTSDCEVPDWYLTVPQDPNFLFSAKSATSQDMQLALDKATTDARTEIGRQTEVRIQGLQKKFDEEVGVNADAQLLQQFTQANKTVVSTSLSGSRIKTQKICQDASTWRSYVLVEYPIGAANQALMEQLKKNEQMYTRFRSSQTFKELDDEVQKYEDWKKQQGQTPPTEIK